MKFPLRIAIWLLGFMAFCNSGELHAQYITVSGTVYDISGRRPIEAVAVLSTSGRGTLTDSSGKYILTVRKQDSIWFSLIGKNTMKYAVDTMNTPHQFDISIMLQASVLPDVQVRNNNYRLDSLQNRRDYAKYFDYKKPTVRFSTNNNYNPGGLTTGLDLTELINMFRVRKMRNMENLQKRLIMQEQDKYVSHRFNKVFVRKVTQLVSPDLDTFMNRYRPEYELLVALNDLELAYYTQKCYEHYRANRYRPRPLFRRKEDEVIRW